MIINFHKRRHRFIDLLNSKIIKYHPKMLCCCYSREIEMSGHHFPAITTSTFYPRRTSLNGASIIAAVNFSRRSNSVDQHHYVRNASRYWDKFYKCHQNKFFKDRHYLEKDWGNYFDGKVVLEVGCGAGNTIFPLVAAYPKLYMHACDFSPRAIDIVKSHETFRDDRINAFVCNISHDDLTENIRPSSVDVVTLIFMLSAVSPEYMQLILQNIKKVLKPHGHVLVRDYAIGDFAQLKLQEKNQMISENFYFRGDGTCSYYFSEETLSNLFTKAGFATEDITMYCKRIENRSRNVIMDRRWIRAIFKNLDLNAL